jgi:hypothetical protein
MFGSGLGRTGGCTVRSHVRDFTTVTTIGAFKHLALGARPKGNLNSILGGGTMFCLCGSMESIFWEVAEVQACQLFPAQPDWSSLLASYMVKPL